MMYRWLKRASRVTASFVVALVVSTTFLSNKLTKAANTDDIAGNTVPDSSCDAFYMIISTIDGKVSVLDLHRHGQLAWTKEADTRPLVSSSLANLEMIRNGKKMRLIPALDGAIYQFDGDKVEPIPMSAESLLSSTYQLSDDAMIVGSKSLQNFGINIKTGEVQFICSSEGCSKGRDETQDQANGSDVLVVTRVTQVVRSVDIKHGHEKWNFSVGEHLLSLPHQGTQSQIEDQHDAQDHELPYLFTGKQDKKCPYTDDPGDENFLRLVVPEGKVVALNKQDSSRVAWEHKFNSPIAKAWLLRKGKLHVMNLFTEQHIPTMNTFTPDDIETDSSTQPLLYIGSHQKILYIQPSPGMEAVLKMYSGRRIGHVFDPKIKVAWRPYLNTASFRTPVFGGNRQSQMNNNHKKNVKNNQALTVWHEEYPFDTGYFLYPEFKDRSVKKPMLIEDLHKFDLENTLINFFWSYRKEIMVLVFFTVCISLGVDFLIAKVLVTKSQHNVPNQSVSGNSFSSSENGSDGSVVTAENAPPLTKKISTSEDYYISRFETDFDCVQCLGKGGFGVVMEAVNKVDEQHYAVKRIKLPRSEEAKEKVLREVKVLAKLEHIGIVRFFNAWVETPPPGWQEEKDANLGLSDASRQTITNITPSPAIRSSSSLGKKNKRKSRFVSSGLSTDCNDSDTTNFGSRLDRNLNTDTNTNTDSVVFASEDSTQGASGLQHQRSGSGKFSLHSNISDSDSSSSSTEWSLLKDCRGDPLKQTLSIEDEESHSCSRSSVPFSNYSVSSSRQSPARDDELSLDSVIFEEESKSLIKKLSDNRNQSKHAEVNTSLSSIDEGNNTTEKTELVCSKHEQEQGVKYFLYIQMQLYKKETLKEWLYNNTLNRNRAGLMDIFDQLLCAVDYIHTCGLMHRDLKPSNIFFTEDGVVKVGDFGLVTPLSIQEDDEFSNTTGVQSSGHTADVGTTLYMSPEQLAKKPYNLKVDVFSLGLILLELWVPFSTQMERIRTLQDARKHILPARFERELPAESELVKKMTCKDPSDRPNIKELMDHSLLKDLVPTRFAQPQRSRTISNNSNNSSNSIHE